VVGALGVASILKGSDDTSGYRSSQVAPAPAIEPELAVEPSAPAATQAPVTAPPESTLAELVEELWVATGYCYTDCTQASSPEEWVDRAEMYGPIDTDEFVGGYEYLATTTSIEMDAVCTEFWDMPDSEVAQLALETGIDPPAWILNMYVWCDS
jgi:hypothetical protein